MLVYKLKFWYSLYAVLTFVKTYVNSANNNVRQGNILSKQ